MNVQLDQSYRLYLRIKIDLWICEKFKGWELDMQGWLCLSGGGGGRPAPAMVLTLNRFDVYHDSRLPK